MFCPGPKRSDMFARCIFILLKHAETRQTNVHTADPHYWNAPPLWYLQEPCLYLGSQHGKLRPACCGNTLDVTFSGWWFQTFFIFHHTWDNPSHWLSYFSQGLKPPTSIVVICHTYSLLGLRQPGCLWLRPAEDQNWPEGTHLRHWKDRRFGGGIIQEW